MGSVAIVPKAESFICKMTTRRTLACNGEDIVESTRNDKTAYLLGARRSNIGRGHLTAVSFLHAKTVDILINCFVQIGRLGAWPLKVKTERASLPLKGGKIRIRCRGLRTIGKIGLVNTTRGERMADRGDAWEAGARWPGARKMCRTGRESQNPPKALPGWS